jgi:PPOX class probable F420-dependent enzyme
MEGEKDGRGLAKLVVGMNFFACLHGKRAMQAGRQRKERKMSVIPQNAMDLLKANGLAHIATLGPKGEPQSTPVWFDWDGNYIRFSQTKGRQKYRNVQRDKRIALSITDPQNPYHYLEVRGEVDHIEEDPRKSFIDLLAKKYMGVDQYPYNQPGEERVIVYVKPEHTTTQ